MGKGLNFPFLADVRQLLRGTRDAGDAVDEIGDSLEELARDSKRSSDRVSDSMRDVARDTERAGDQVERAFRDAFDEASRSSRDASRDMGRNTERGFDRAGDASREFKREVGSNAAEAASSFRGDMDSAFDAVQGTLGGLTDAIPGVGLALGALGAVAGTVYYQWRDNAEKIEQRISDMYNDMVESGEDYISEEFMRNALRDIFDEADDAVVSMERLREVAELLGASEAETARAFAGDMELRQQLIDQATEKLQDYYDLAVEASKEENQDRAGALAAYDAAAAYEAVVEQLQALNDEQSESVDRVNSYRQAVSLMEGQSSTDAEARRFENLRGMIDGATESAAGLASALGSVPSPTIAVRLDTRDAERQLALLTRARTTRITASAVTRDGRRVY